MEQFDSNSVIAQREEGDMDAQMKCITNWNMTDKNSFAPTEWEYDWLV